MKLRSYAKINLILDVLKKKENGYHEIDFLMTNVDIYDTIFIEKSSKDEVIVKNNISLSNEKNLAYKALKLLKNKYEIKTNYKIIIDKKIPIGAGMAGGSSNAAAVLKGINTLEKLKLSNSQLSKTSSDLGRDIPFCIHSKLARVCGEGEDVKLIEKKIKKSNVLIINPGYELKTKDVYENHSIRKIDGLDISDILKLDEYEIFYSSLRNSLEKTTFLLSDDSLKIYNELKKYNLTKVMVSGSGPTILVFDQNIDKLKEIFDEYKKKYKHVYLTKVIT